MAGTGKGPLRIVLEDWLNTFDFGKIVSKWTRTVIDDMELEVLDIFQDAVNILGLQAVGALYIQPLKDSRKVRPAPAWFLMAATALIGMVVGIFSGATRPYSRMAEYAQDVAKRTYRPPVTELVALFRNGTISQDQLIQWSADQGIPDQVLIGFQDLIRRTPDIAETISLFWRGIIGEDLVQRYFIRQGVPSDLADQYLELYRRIPGPADLVSMAVREAWNEETVSRFQYDADFPPEFGEWMTKQGYSQDWAKRYWRAHWQLPGVNQAYEMLHRLRPGKSEHPFTTDDMETLLRTADIPVFFRQRLIDISYAPFTRVDVRRMFGAGVLTKDQVLQAYLDLGYNQERAEALTEFTTRIEKAQERGLTKEAITGAYKRGLYSRDQAQASIQDIGYTAEDADFWLDLADFDLQAALTDDKLAVIKAKYVNHILDESTVMDQLGPLNLPAERLQVLLDGWNVQRNNTYALPSRAEVDDMHRRGLLDDQEYKIRLERIGYQADAIQLFAIRIDQIIEADAQAAAIDAQTEQERLVSSTRASEYSKAVADLNVQAAEIDLATAQIKLALPQVTDPDQVQALQDQVKQYAVIKKEIALQKAQLKLDLTSQK